MGIPVGTFRVAVGCSRGAVRSGRALGGLGQVLKGIAGSVDTAVGRSLQMDTAVGRSLQMDTAVGRNLQMDTAVCRNLQMGTVAGRGLHKDIVVVVVGTQIRTYRRVGSFDSLDHRSNRGWCERSGLSAQLTQRRRSRPPKTKRVQTSL